jgi:predicted MPP superfamily phosphohydrolase
MREPKLLLAEFLFYGSYLVLRYLAWAAWRWRRTRRHGRFAVRLFPGLLVIWMRFVEPHELAGRETAIPLGTGARIALISDLHLGVYKDAAFVTRLARRLNARPADCVLIAGDFLYAPNAPLDQLFAGLKQIHAPVYAVLGNHDSHELGWPRGGEVDREDLIAALARAGVRVIENQIADCGAVRIAGVGDHWSGREDFRRAAAYRGQPPLLLLTHNPDSAYDAPRGVARLLLAGHTHGGQIRLPLLYRYVIPVKGPFDRGLVPVVDWSDDPAGRPAVFVTSGVGEVGLPLRLFNPPVIDWLAL